MDSYVETNPFKNALNLVIIWKNEQMSDRRQEFPQVFVSSDQPCVLAWRCCPVTATAGSSWRRRRDGPSPRPAAEHWSNTSAPARNAAGLGTAASLGRRQGSSEQPNWWYLLFLLLGYCTQWSRVKNYKINYRRLLMMCFATCFVISSWTKQPESLFI